MISLGGSDQFGSHYLKMADDTLTKALQMDDANRRNRIKAEALIAEANKPGADPVQIAQACVDEELPVEWIARVVRPCGLGC